MSNVGSPVSYKNPFTVRRLRNDHCRRTFHPQFTSCRPVCCFSCNASTSQTTVLASQLSPLRFTNDERRQVLFLCQLFPSLEGSHVLEFVPKKKTRSLILEFPKRTGGTTVVSHQPRRASHNTDSINYDHTVEAPS